MTPKFKAYLRKLYKRDPVLAFRALYDWIEEEEGASPDSIVWERLDRLVS